MNINQKSRRNDLPLTVDALNAGNSLFHEMIVDSLLSDESKNKILKFMAEVFNPMPDNVNQGYSPVSRTLSGYKNILQYAMERNDHSLDRHERAILEDAIKSAVSIAGRMLNIEVSSGRIGRE